MRKKRIVIIGGFGFMGKNLTNILSDDYEVLCVSRRNGFDLKNDPIKIKQLLIGQSPDYVINAVAHCGSIHYVNQNSADVISDNLLMGLNLWNILKEIKYKGVVINPISNCTYPGDADLQIEDEWWNGPVHPSIIAYGLSKKTIQVVTKCYESQYDIKTLNIILPNSYGEYDHDDTSRVHALNGIIMRMLKAQKNNDKEFVVWGTGTPIREWAYMPDTARFMKFLIDNEVTNIPNPLNMGRNEGYTINEITHTVKEALNYDVKIVHDTTKMDGDPIKILDGSIFKFLYPNFKFTDLKEGVQNTINYYKNRL